jgi:glycosyltransferase involved in cell wall biosynthesis
MRIASISLHWPRTLNSGVGKKLDRQIKLWQAGGHEARLFMHTSRYTPASELLPAEVFPYEVSGKLRTELNRIRAAVQLVEAVQAYRPDLVYLRLGMYVWPIHRLAEIAPVIGEANTNDLTQHEGLGGVYALYNRLTRGLLLRRLCGLVTVSRELAAAPAFTAFHKPIRVIANGIDLENQSPLPAPSNPVPRLAFIGNPGYLWHGVDKLVTLAKLHPDLQVEVIGYDQLAGFETLPANLHTHGYLATAAYERILTNADAAISSLGLHRIGLKEASPLKSRECLALGLPLVVAYIDTDMHDLNLDFILRIPNQEDNVLSHGKAIRDFAYRMRGRRVDRQKIGMIDQANKEAERLDFFYEIISTNPKG